MNVLSKCFGRCFGFLVLIASSIFVISLRDLIHVILQGVTVDKNLGENADQCAEQEHVDRMTVIEIERKREYFAAVIPDVQ